MAEVVDADPDQAGLHTMLVGLLAGAIEDPAKAAILDRMTGTVTITLPDVDVRVGLRFRSGVCRVHAGPIPGSKVHLEMPSGTLLGMASVPLLAGLPSPLSPDGRDFARQLLTRRVRIQGLRHIGLLTGLNRLLSVAGPRGGGASVDSG